MMISMCHFSILPYQSHKITISQLLHFTYIYLLTLYKNTVQIFFINFALMAAVLGLVIRLNIKHKLKYSS